MDQSLLGMYSVSGFIAAPGRRLGCRRTLRSSVNNDGLWCVVAGTDMVALKMRGLPWRVEVDEIEQFFSRYAYIRESIRVGALTDGRKTGQAALLFENPDEANNAMNEKQGQNVGSRWVELYQMPYSQY